MISAPSGAGKTTLCDALRKSEDFHYAVSCTTRAPRAGEIDGKDYYFISEEEFTAKVAADEFLEYAGVHLHRYGTLKAPVLEHLLKGNDVLMDIDTVGAETIRKCANPIIQNALADVFLIPPSLEELQHRLTKRGTESPTEIQTRLHNAETEIKKWCHYRYIIISHSIEDNIVAFRSILRAERCLTRRYQSISL